ncbi:DUF2398 family protein [Streptomyces gardneri]|uniref:DUF2398 family protein n=1 Tax=Streptomyces gardneri TaxID=66892 RepID=UPI0007168FD9|nr:DUF2398 family protein [Streptomyces gardneri]QPK43209.1 DUF2398 family protein [Streptomyces gardneri]QPK50251.1 DUF2398 family protein [Streptomyces gardneri]WRK34421.1 DUF2398 family protein [Streptomyces venezuelae]
MNAYGPWGQGEDEEEAVWQLARLLKTRAWLVGGRDDAAIDAVYRHRGALREVLAAVGCALVVEPDLVRVYSPAPPLSARLPQGDSARGVWFWLTVGVLESLPGRVRLGQVTAAARTAAAEIELPVTQSRTELSALAAGLRQLCDYGVLEELEGRVEALMDGGEDPPVLLKVHHTRLLHVLPRGVQVDEWGQWAVDPGEDPAGWLAGLARPADAGVRVCAMLADQAVVHACDLDEDELRWLSDQGPTDGAALARSFGLALEHRVEGAAWVMPQETYDERVAGRFRFPGRSRSHAGTVPHAALLLIDSFFFEGERGGAGAPGPGWCGMPKSRVVGRLGELAKRHAWWSKDLRGDLPRLAQDVRGVLEPEADLLRVTGGFEEWWWLSPAAARWTVLSEQAPVVPAQCGEVGKGVER